MNRLATLTMAAAVVSIAAPARADVPRSIPAPVVDADYYDAAGPRPAKVELGRLLYFDKILSGNRNIACATCHHPRLASGDALTLPLGEGPKGLGTERTVGTTKAEAVHARVPRNSPAVFNLGAREFVRLFLDGRVEEDPHGYYEGGFITPAKWKLPKGLDNVLAAQAMFPVGSSHEMAGQKGENPIADASSLNNMAGPGGVWEQLAHRLQIVPEYVERFRDAYPCDVRRASDITYIHAANAIAAFETVEFRSDGSPFDRYLRGEMQALDASETRGLALFYGKAGCSSCHSGKFQTDHDFHAIAMPQIGPGKADGRDAHYWRASGHESFVEDFGRGRVTMRPEDNFKFRTPSLRNVELTGPWGHAGAYLSLEAVVRHHLNPIASLETYEVPADALPDLGPVLETTASGSHLSQEFLAASRLEGFRARDGFVQRTPELRHRIAEANELSARALTDAEVSDLIAFLCSLTDPAARDLSSLVPESVPSGLPVED